MRAKLWQLLEDLNDSFWLRPALMVVSAGVLATSLVGAEGQGLFAPHFITAWLYSGGETGARTLLGAIAGSTIGVAGTVFSITIATLTLASNQLGPRLLRNFTRDRGNQATLGMYLGTFVYALLVLRSVRGTDEGAFVPHLAITGAVVLALACVAMLIYFVHHIASRINADTVIDLVYRDLRDTLLEITTSTPPPATESEILWSNGAPVDMEHSGFLQQLDETFIADWAAERAVSVRLHARVGVFLFPGTRIATVVPPRADAARVVRSALALGAYPTSSMDIEYSVTQLTDIAIRALSPGINDPNTAIRAVDRLGAALCVLAGRHLPSGIIVRQGLVVFERDTTTYAGLMDAMFHTIRQSAEHSPSVLIHLLEVLGKVAECEHWLPRVVELDRHAGLILADGLRTIQNIADRETLTGRLADLSRTLAASRMMSCSASADESAPAARETRQLDRLGAASGTI
ncbi:MAG: DUF2254 domain-containing protein [Gammaproteobacteria bacterium]